MIVITGGPCAGKSTLLSNVQQKLGDLGWTVVTVSEAATDFILGGLKPWEIKQEAFQYQLLRYIISKEESYRATASLLESEKVVVLCDRGRMDARAYMDTWEFDRMLGTLGYNVVDLNEKPYDAVVFLRSVAYDKPELFTCENNEARTEDATGARLLDERTLEAWQGHPHLSVIGNEGTFEQKLHRAFVAICHALAIPAPLEIERKFLFTGEGRVPVPPVPFVVNLDVEQYYLRSDTEGVEERVRARGRDGGKMHYHTFKEPVSPGVRIERERQITPDEYFELLKRVDPALGKVEKWRRCFIWQNQYFEMDTITRLGRVYLEVELTEEGQEVTLPPGFEDCFVEVTGQAEHSNYELARLLGKR
jgi:CYTH domain-containing protein/predicted ATPase